MKYGFKLRLTDLLIKPIQRLTKYHMLLEAILKHSLRAGLELEAKSVEMAFQVMTVVPNQANDMMDIGRLQGFEVSYIHSYSRLKTLNLHDNLTFSGKNCGSREVAAERSPSVYR